ncbi:MAG: M12 family metallo-peptidase [Cytophagaceae bacterium]
MRHFLIVFFLIVFPILSQSQDLILKEVNPSDYGINIEGFHKGAEFVRSRLVLLNKQKIGESFIINPFPEYQYKVKRKQFQYHASGSSYIGQLEGIRPGYVIISFVNGFVSGKIVEDQGPTFLIDELKNDIFLITEVNPNVLTEGAADGVIFEEQRTGNNQRTESTNVCDAASICDPVTIDVMVVYTPAAKALAPGGTDDAIKSRIVTAIAEMNTANTNSGVIHTVNLVHSAEVSYVEGDANTDLGRLRNTSDGFMDIVHTWRNTYKADLVALVVNTGCGLGYLQTNSTTFNSSNGFSLVSYSCMTTNRSLAHEFGHNMSLRHDIYVDNATTPCTRHHGYVNQNATPSTGRWRTIMAYNNQCSDAGELGGSFNCTRLNYWSNPDRTYMGDPMGHTVTANNVFALNRAACKVAQFMINPLPLTLLDFQSQIESGKVKLSWNTISEVNTSHFEVEKSEDGITFQKIAHVLAAGNFSGMKSYMYMDVYFTNNSFYRLKMVDKDGTYTYSNVVHQLIDDFDNVMIYPQPVSSGETFFINVQVDQTADVTLVDYLGKQLKLNYKINESFISAETTDLSKGAYVVLIRDNKSVRSFRLIIN